MSTAMFMLTQTPEAQDQMWSQLRAAETQRAQYQQAANAAVSRSIGDFHSRVPYADPGVALGVGSAIARGQVDPAVAAAAVDQSTAAGNRPAWSAKESAGIVDTMRMGVGLPSTAMAHQQALRALEMGSAGKNDKLILDAQGNIDTAATLKAAGVDQGGGGAFDWTSPGDYLSSAADTIGTGVKGVTREALSVAQSGWEAAQNRGAQGIHAVQDVGTSLAGGDIGGAVSAGARALAVYSPMPPVETWYNKQVRSELLGAAEATNVGQQVAQQAQLGSVDLGEGFFPGGTVTHTWQPQEARDVRGVIPGTNSAWTYGRGIASLIQQPGTKQYNLMSGFIDGAMQFAVDPTIATSDALLAGRKAAQLIEAAPKVAEAVAGGGETAKVAAMAGAAAPTVGPEAVRDAAQGVLIDAERPSANAMRADRFIEHPAVQPFVQRLTDTHDPLEVMHQLGPDAPPSLISAVTNSSDLDTTKALMRDELGLSFQSTADLPGLKWNYGLKRQVIRNLPGIGDESGDIAARAFQTVPDRRLEGFRWDATPLQERQTMDSIHDALKTVNVPYADRSALMGKFADAFAAGTSEDKYNALMAYSDAVNQGMKAMGAPEEFADTMSKIWKDTHDTSSLYGIDAVGRPADSGFMATATGNANLSMISPAKLSEGMSGDVYLPDFRQVRRMTSTLGRILSDTSGPNPETWGQILKPGLSHMQYAAEKIFPRLQVTRIATALRIFGDEQVGLAAQGLDTNITHPFQLAAAVLGSSTDLERLGYDPKTIQAMMDEAGSSLFNADAPDKLLRAARATGHWDAVPFASEHGVQGGLDMARQFNRDPISAMWAQGKSTDQIIDWLHGQSSVEQTVQTRALADLQAQEGSLFHGTSRPWTTGQPNPDIYAGRSAENLMGAGLYTTDNPKVALSYTSKGAGGAAETLGGVKVSEGGRVYQMRWQQPPSVLDLEQPQREVTDFLQRWVNSNRDATWLESSQESWDHLESLVADPNASAAAQIKAWRGTLSGLPTSEADDVVSDLADHLADTHDALRYTGGVRTGNETHNAYVVLHPEKLAVEASHAPVGVTSATERVVVPGATAQVAGRNGPDAFKQYVKMGANAVARDAETGARVPAPVNLLDNDTLRGWIEQNIGGQVDSFTKGNTDLRNAIGYNRLPSDGVLTSGGAPITIDPETGAPLGVAFQDGQATPEMKQMVRDWSNHPDAPEQVKWNRTVMDRPDPNTMKKQWDYASSALMGGLFDTPLKTLTRSPLFRTEFFDRVAELGSKMSPEAANGFLADIRANADEQGMVGKIAEWLGGQDRLGKVVDSLGQASGDLTKDEVTQYALGHAVDTVKSALFDHGRMTNVEQTLRSFVPFVGAWRQVLGRWTRLIAQNPGIVRRFQTVVQGARGAGFFFTDPVTGEERFNFPGSDWLAHTLTGGGLATAATAAISQNLGGVASHLPVVGPAIQSGIGAVVNPLVKALPVVGAGLGGVGPGVDNMSLGANVKDLNIVSGSFLPGFGPLIQMPAAHILGNIPQADFIRGLLMPYGVPTDENSPFGEPGAYLLPGWAQKISSAITSNPDSASSFGNTYMQVVQNLASSGKYGTGMDDRRQMLDDAKNYARVLTVLRGLGQFTSPASPSYDTKIATKQGDVLMSQLAADFHTMQSQDYNSAVQTFLDTYGEGPFIAAMSKTKSVNGGLDASTEFGNWERDHGGTIGSYPNVAAYFAPVGSDFDFEVYNRQLASGERQKLSGDEMVNAAQATLAEWKYRQAQAMLGDHPNVAQLNWLTEVKQKLQDQYPGYAVAPGNPEAFSTKVQQLTKASTDPGLKGDIQTALATYLWFRNQALTSAQQRAGGRESAAITSTQNADLRAWLAGAANQIIAKYPTFARMYDGVLAKEVNQ